MRQGKNENLLEAAFLRFFWYTGVIFFHTCMLYADRLRQLGQHCPFCYPEQEILAQNAHAFLTFALAPYHKHHLLVVPKDHMQSVFELQLEHYVALDTLSDLAFDLLRALGYDSLVTLTREGPKSGKSIRHLHKHIIPEVAMVLQSGDLGSRQLLEAEEQAILAAEFRGAMERIHRA